jgi:hypothetical protein
VSDPIYTDPTAPAPDIAGEEEARAEWANEAASRSKDAGVHMLNEMVKSFGIAVTDEGVDFSLDRINEARKESPVFFALDWGSILYAPARFGIAAAQVAKFGTGAVSRAHRAGHFAGRAARTRKGRATEKVGRLFGQEGLGAATEFKLGSPAQTRVGAFFQSPIDVTTERQFEEIVGQYGGSTGDIRGIFAQIERESVAAENFVRRVGEDIQVATGRAKLDPHQKEAFTRFMENGVMPDDPDVLAALGATGAKAYDHTFWFRDQIHESAFNLGLISEETYSRNLQKYFPAMYEEFVKGKAARKRGRAAAAGAASLAGRGRQRGPSFDSWRMAHEGVDRFKGRRHLDDPAARRMMEEEFGRILDPSVGIDELGKAAMTVHTQGFAQRLASSVIAQDAGSVFEKLSDVVMGGNPKLAKLYNISEDLADEVRDIHAGQYMGQGGLETAEAAMETVARKAGWQRIDDYYDMVGKKVPPYIARLPQEFREKFIDPTVLEDVVGMFQFAEGSKHWWMRGYHQAMSYFRASKTAYNPATHFRNYLGGSVFHHLAVGGMPSIAPRRAVKSFLDGLSDHHYKEFAEAGGFGTSFTSEIDDILREAWGPLYEGKKQVSSVDFMHHMTKLPGGEKLFKATQTGASKAEHFYRSIDEVWKLQAFIDLKKQKLKTFSGGKFAGRKWSDLPIDVRDSVVAEAMVDVNRYFPIFGQASPFTKMIRGHIPFSSFLTESARIWKNTLTYHPVRAFFWNSQLESMAGAVAVMGGASPEQIEAANSALPQYTNFKKMAVVPFSDKATGKLLFLDLSYIIPAGSIAEITNAENSFFEFSPINIGNPFFDMIAAGRASLDPFSKKPIQPDFTERMLGMPIEGQRARTIVGNLEYIARTWAPPIVPPAYVGVNLMEVASGAKHPLTGQDLEEGVTRSLMTHLMGLRFYEADMNNLLLNEFHESRTRDKRMRDEWNRFPRVTPPTRRSSTSRRAPTAASPAPSATCLCATSVPWPRRPPSLTTPPTTTSP